MTIVICSCCSLSERAKSKRATRATRAKEQRAKERRAKEQRAKEQKSKKHILNPGLYCFCVITLFHKIQGAPDLVTQYVYCFYWSALTLTTIGNIFLLYCIINHCPYLMEKIITFTMKTVLNHYLLWKNIFLYHLPTSESHKLNP